MSRVLPDDAEAGGGLMVAVIQLAIAAGASTGGFLFDRSGYQATFGASAAILIVSALLAFTAWRAASSQLDRNTETSKQLRKASK
jgi:predicted MFS family arabinose efflux permease